MKSQDTQRANLLCMVINRLCNTFYFVWVIGAKWKAISSFFHDTTSSDISHSYAICRKLADKKWNIFDDERKILVPTLPVKLQHVHTLLYIRLGDADPEFSSKRDYITHHVEQLSAFVLSDS